MKIVTFTHRNRTRVGELDGETVYGLTWNDSTVNMIRSGITKPGRNGERFALADVTLEAPLRPGKIVAIGRNYAEHAAETASPLPEKPLIFAKFPSTVIGTGAEITWRTSITNEVDWEVELAVVIGKKTRDVSEEEATNCVFGYTVANDVSARDLQLRQDGQWTRGKSLDTFCPLGPCVVTRGDIADPQNLSLKTSINGEVVQNGSTSDMHFKVSYLIAYISRMFTLYPGDIILTGTPSGVGEGMNPKRFLKDGEEVTVSVENIGSMTNRCRVIED